MIAVIRRIRLAGCRAGRRSYDLKMVGLAAALLLARAWPVTAGSVLDVGVPAAPGATNSVMTVPTDRVEDWDWSSNAMGPAVDPEAGEAPESPLAAATTDVDQVALLMATIRGAYLDALPTETFDPHQMDRFLDDVRQRLESAALIPPLDPDAYRERPLPQLPPVIEGEEGGSVVLDEESSLTLSRRDGRPVYSYRDSQGNILHEGFLDTREDRQDVPFEVWRKLYEFERENRDAQPGR